MALSRFNPEAILIWEAILACERSSVAVNVAVNVAVEASSASDAGSDSTGGAVSGSDSTESAVSGSDSTGSAAKVAVSAFCLAAAALVMPSWGVNLVAPVTALDTSSAVGDALDMALDMALVGYEVELDEGVSPPLSVARSDRGGFPSTSASSSSAAARCNPSRCNLAESSISAASRTVSGAVSGAA
jgi:hypothetical protein